MALNSNLGAASHIGATPSLALRDMQDQPKPNGTIPDGTACPWGWRRTLLKKHISVPEGKGGHKSLAWHAYANTPSLIGGTYIMSLFGCQEGTHGRRAQDTAHTAERHASPSGFWSLAEPRICHGSCSSLVHPYLWSSRGYSTCPVCGSTVHERSIGTWCSKSSSVAG